MVYKLSLNLNGNLYNYWLKGQFLENQQVRMVNTSIIQYSYNISVNYKANKHIGVQLGANYLSRRVTAQGTDDLFYNPFLSVGYYPPSRLSIIAQWQNIDLGLLGSNQQRITTSGENFYASTNYIYEVDIVTLNVVYKFKGLNRKIKFTESEFGEREY